MHYHQSNWIRTLQKLFIFPIPTYLLQYKYTCSKKSDAKIQITIGLGLGLVRFNVPLDT